MGICQNACDIGVFSISPKLKFFPKTAFQDITMSQGKENFSVWGKFVYSPALRQSGPLHGDISCKMFRKFSIYARLGIKKDPAPYLVQGRLSMSLAKEFCLLQKNSLCPATIILPLSREVDLSLCCCQSRDGYAVRGAGYIVQTNLVAELNGVRIAAMLAADTQMDVGANGLCLLNSPLH